jgi:AcrR family transcriptional regulator
MSMAIPYELSGRTQQKARTRSALVAAARELLATGVTPTVEQAADAAQVARATAYRYFPNQRALLVAAYPEIAEPSLLGEPQLVDPGERLDEVARSLTRQMVEHEPELRTMLRLSLEPGAADAADLPFRKGRRITWVRDALAPLHGEMPEREFQRLVHAIAAALGIEALVWLTDVAGLERDEATEVMRWSARALLRSALHDEAGR